MICYMPFTNIEDALAEKLAGALGTITLFSPAQALTPEHMRGQAQKELLDIQYPAQIRDDQLLNAIDEFKRWADLHGGNISEMAGFFQSQKGIAPMMDDTNPSQIMHQVRHYGENATDDTIAPLFKAALFLAMVQEYDQQHQGIAEDLDAVGSMEKQMLKQLTGDDSSEGKALSRVADSQLFQKDKSQYPIMASQRIRAWATIAIQNTQPPLLYLTPSQDVVEHVLDLFPKNNEAITVGLASSRDETGPSMEQIQKIIKKIAFAGDPEVCELEPPVGSIAPEGNERIKLYVLNETAPSAFLSGLSGQELQNKAALTPDDGPLHTLIGHVITS